MGNQLITSEILSKFQEYTMWLHGWVFFLVYCTEKFRAKLCPSISVISHVKL